MKIHIGVGNRLTIPKQFMLDHDIESNREYNMYFSDGKIVIDVSGADVDNVQTNSTEDNKCDMNVSMHKELIDEETGTDSKYKYTLKSNIEDADKLSRKVFSPCSLIVKTKRKYVSALCEKCRGYLYNEYKLKDNSCPYLIVDDSTNNSCDTEDTQSIDNKTNVMDKPIEQVIKDTNSRNTPIDNTTKSVTPNQQLIENIDSIKNTAKSIAANISKVSEYIDNLQNKTVINKSRRKSKNLVVRNNSTTLNFISLDDYKQCSKCHEYVDSGFLIDDDFFCKECASKDFKNYLDVINKYRKEGR